MTNLEKHLDDIIAVLKSGDDIALVEGKIVCCSEIDCDKCGFDWKFGNEWHNCASRQMEWLKAEYLGSEVDWSKVPIDTKVLTSNDGEIWYHRHYAGLDSDNNPTVWVDGGTAWSKGELIFDKANYEYVKLAEVD